MYRIKEIQDALLHLVGWDQSYDPDKAIERHLTQSESGLYFQGAHPLVTLDNIRAIMPEEFLYQYPTWNMIKVYQVGTVVRHNNEVWIATKVSKNEEPKSSDFNADFDDDFGNPYWQVYNYMSDYLERITRNGISQMVQTFVQVKKLEQETKNILERKMLSDGAGRVKDIIQNNHKLVGFEFVPARSMGVTLKIERIGLQMTGGTGVIKMYLFHSSQINPIKTFKLDFTNPAGGFQWFPLNNCFLPYISDENNSGGAWFLCYNQDELPRGMQAVNTFKDWSRSPCSTCTGYGNTEDWQQLSKYLQVSPFMYNAPETFAEYPELWDIAKTMYTNTQSYGINCEVTLGCDLTDFIIKERNIFQTVLQRQVAVNILRTMALNPEVRVNRNQSNVSRMDVLYEIDGNTSGMRPNGLGYELKKAYEALELDTRGIDRICLSCNNKGVRYRST